MKLQQIKMLAYGLILVFPVLLILDVMGYQWLRRTQGALEAEVHAEEVLRAQEKTLAALTVAEFAAREVLTAKGLPALDFYRTARANTFAAFDSLKPYGESNPEVRKPLDALGPFLAQEFALVDQRIESPDQGPSRAPDMSLESKLAQLGEKSRGQLEAIHNSEDRALALSQEMAEGGSKRAAMLLEGGDALALWSVALAALLVFRDTQRRAWAGSERRMQSRALEALPLAVFVTDDHGIILYSNASAQALFGYKGDNLLGRHISFAEGDRAASEERHQAIDVYLADSASWKGEFEARKSNGATFHCALVAARMDVSDKPFQLCIYEKISEPAAT